MNYQIKLKCKMAAWQLEAAQLEKRLMKIDIGLTSPATWETIYSRYNQLQDYIYEGHQRLVA